MQPNETSSETITLTLSNLWRVSKFDVINIKIHHPEKACVTLKQSINHILLADCLAMVFLSSFHLPIIKNRKFQRHTILNPARVFILNINLRLRIRGMWYTIFHMYGIILLRIVLGFKVSCKIYQHLFVSSMFYRIWQNTFCFRGIFLQELKTANIASTSAEKVLNFQQKCLRVPQQAQQCNDKTTDVIMNCISYYLFTA